QARRHEFNQQTPSDQIRSWGDPAHILKQQDGWLVKQPGTEEWIWCGFNYLWGVRGDYDVTLALDVLKMEETAGNHETYFLIQNRVSSSFLNAADFKISSTGRGRRE